MKKVLAIIVTLAMILTLAPVSVGAKDTTPTLTINLADTSGHEVLHGSAGFLYGISNEGVPDVNTLTPLKPKVLATKGALGTEHPYADALDVADEFFEAGGQQVQMYNSNYYGVFGVTANANDYGVVLRNTIAPAVSEWKNEKREKYPDIDARMVYIPINEGTPVNGVANFNEAWRIYYQSIKASDSTAYIAGPNDATYRGHNGMYDYLNFCKQNNCLPDVVTWHELQVSCLTSMGEHIADYKSICQLLDIEEKQVVINEYAATFDCGVPGRLVNWIARFEDNQVYACLPFWHQANNLNDLAASANEGNGAWQVYKWYGDMTGKTLAVNAQNTTYDGFYGVAAMDEGKRNVALICGGVDGNARVNIDGINDTLIFTNAQRVHVRVEAARFSGYHGAMHDTDAILDGAFEVKNGRVSIDLTDCMFATAYRITVTNESEENPPAPTIGVYRSEYEAENATFYGNVSLEYQSSPRENPKYYFSGGVRVGDFNTTSDAIEYTISVPYDGKYKLEFIYGNGVGSTRNNSSTHKPLNIVQTLTIDGEEEELYLPNTLFYSMQGKADKYADLTRGKHHIRLAGGTGAYQDVLYVSYAGAYGEPIPIYNKRFEAENADYNAFGGESTVTTQNTIEGFSGSGYAIGLEERTVESGGGIRFVTSVEESGIYNLAFRIKSSEDGSLRVFKDNTNLTYTNHLTDIAFSASDEWQTVYKSVYLKRGINIFDIDTTIVAAIDYMRLVKTPESGEIYEAENADGIFTTATAARGEVYIVGTLGSATAYDDAYIELTLNAPTQGDYILQTFQSNNDLCGTHSYSIKIIDKYATFEVNGDRENAKRYFFPNSFSDDTFLEKSIPVTLNAGINTVRIYNDNSQIIKYGGSTSTPGTNVLVNYAPNFDKFVLYSTLSDVPLQDIGYKVSVNGTKGGSAYADKTVVSEGESVMVTLIAEGQLSKVSVNGIDKTSALSDEGNGVYTLTIENIFSDIEVFAEFKAATEIPFDNILADGTLSYNSQTYKIASDNLFPNSKFSDNSGADMDVWYRGINTAGHPSSSSYQIPLPEKENRAAQNLVPIAENGKLLTGVFEPANVANTFYYGTDSTRTYLVENVIGNPNPWQSCAWNGALSLMAFVPIKPNTKYYFSYEAFTAAGAASVRYGAVDTEENSANFYVDRNYSENQGLKFSGSGYSNCNNGNMQNVGGSWQTHETLIETGDSADFFLFNAYWLQVSSYLCMGDFKLIELEEAQTEIKEIVSPNTITVAVGENVVLPETVELVTSDGMMNVNVQWQGEELIDTRFPGAYIIHGVIAFPIGCYMESGACTASARIIVTGEPSDVDRVSADTAELEVPSVAVTNLSLNNIATHGSSIEWSSDYEEVLSSTGVINRPAEGSADALVNLHAVISSGGISEEKDFEVRVPAMHDTQSFVATADYSYRTFAPTKKGAISFDIKSIALVDGVVAICQSATQPATWENYSVVFRLCTDGHMDAFNGSTHTYTNLVSYEADKTYHVRIVFDTDSTYNVYVSDGENTYTLAKDFAYRTSAADLSKITVRGGAGVPAGMFTVSNITIDGSFESQIMDAAKGSEAVSFYTLLPTQGKKAIFVAFYNDNQIVAATKVGIDTAGKTTALIPSVEYDSFKLLLWDANSVKPAATAKMYSK